MADKVITISGQRVNIVTPTDYQAIFMDQLFDGENIVFDRARHSDFLAMMVEVIAPGLPKRFYKKTASGYWWLGSAQEFGEMLGGLSVICRETFPQYFVQDAATESNIAESLPTEPIQEPSLDELKLELEKLRSQLNS